MNTCNGGHTGARGVSTERGARTWSSVQKWGGQFKVGMIYLEEYEKMLKEGITSLAESKKR